MPIDDPVSLVIQQAEGEIADSSYLPKRLVKLGLSALTASALAQMPAIAQIAGSLLNNAQGRFERRLLQVLEELNNQQKRIEKKIPDKRYFESEEFHALLFLAVERLHAVHDEEKLRMLGDALANSGTPDFSADEKEDDIRTLRDLSRRDLEVLKNSRLRGWIPHLHQIKHDTEVLSSLSRLVGMGNQRGKPPIPIGTAKSALRARPERP